jgi:hypothetical protein
MYSVKWGLTINVNKTKICVFEKRKQIRNFNWFIDGNSIEELDSFCYLGIKFSKNGNFALAVKCLADQALRAVNNLKGAFKRIPMDLKTKLEIFDHMIVPILLYGAEVWGIYGLKQIDKIQIKFYKYILGIHPKAMNMAVLGEFGKFPLSCLALERSFKYWCKIQQDIGSLKHSIYVEQSTVLQNKSSSWVCKIKNKLNQLGVGYLYTNYNRDFDAFHTIQRRIRDQFIQSWRETITTSPKMHHYAKYKNNFEFEPYLQNIKNDTLRIAMTKFRISCHNLAIETGRYQGIDRNARNCLICNKNLVESEYHFLCICTTYSDIRHKYNIKSVWPSTNEFELMISSKNRTVQLKLAKFIRDASRRRQDILKEI